MNQESINDLKQYLLSLNTASCDKRYTMNFYKKIEYLESLKHEAINDLHCNISSGYGNVNSEICFIFSNEQRLLIIKSLIQDILEKLKMNFWSIYTTFIDKSSQEYPKKYNYLMNELNAIKPSIIYVFDNNKNCIDILKQEYCKYNISIPNNYFQFVNIQQLSSSKEEDRIALWNVFKYMIGYREIEK